MTATLTSVQFIAPFAPPMITGADVDLDYPSFCGSFPQSFLRRLWARLVLGSRRASRVVARITNSSGGSALAVCDLSWGAEATSCRALVSPDPLSFKVERGARIEILRQSWRLQRKAEPGAPPNGGPAIRSGDSGASGGPPSVS